MLLDSTFLIQLEHELRLRGDDASTPTGPALQFLARHHSKPLSISPICAGEFYAGCQDFSDARRFLAGFNSLALTDAVATQAGINEREQRAKGRPMGENDNWIAATARHYVREIVSRDKGFDGVRGVKRVTY